MYTYSPLLSKWLQQNFGISNDNGRLRALFTCRSPEKPMPRQEIHFPLKDTALRDDVHMLGALVGEVLQEQGGEALFAAVEGDRQAALARRSGDTDAAVQLALRTRDRSSSGARDLVRALLLVSNGEHGGEGASHLVVDASIWMIPTLHNRAVLSMRCKKCRRKDCNWMTFDV